MPRLHLGAFAIDRSGALEPREAGAGAALRFAWRGVPCRAELAAGAVRIAAIPGRIPSTADPAADRPAALAALAALPPSMPPGWALRLLPDHRICMEVAETLATPPTVVALLTRLVRFVLAMDPYLDRLASAGAEAPGSVKTWPG